MSAGVQWRGADAERVRARNASRVEAMVHASEVRAIAEGRAQRAPGVALNLESSSHCVPPVFGYSVTEMDFGDGIVEARACITVRRRTAVSSRMTKEERAVAKEAGDADRRVWNSQRAARSLRYRCLALKADRMFTFTKRGKFASVDEVRVAWKRFHAMLRKLPNLDMPYVAVPELHGDGQTWHLHVAVRGYQSVTFLRKLWYRALDGRGDETGENTPGSVNVRYFESRRKAALSVASYMAKYLSKSFKATQGTRKSYWCSQGLVPLTVQRYWEPYGDDIMVRVRDNCAPIVPKQCLWRVFEWEYVGLHGFVMRTF